MPRPLHASITQKTPQRVPRRGCRPPIMKTNKPSIDTSTAVRGHDRQRSCTTGSGHPDDW